MPLPRVPSRRRARLRREEAAGGGGGAPNLITLDFDTETYQMNGVDVPVTDIITGFDGNVINGTGLRSFGKHWQLTPAAVAVLVASGFTVVGSLEGGTDTNTNCSFECYDDDNFGTDYLLAANTVLDYNGASVEFLIGSNTGQAVKFAATLIPGDRIAGSQNGAAVGTIETLVTAGAIALIKFNASASEEDDGAIRSVVFKAPVPDADLPALSALEGGGAPVPNLVIDFGTNTYSINGVSVAFNEMFDSGTEGNIVDGKLEAGFPISLLAEAIAVLADAHSLVLEYDTNNTGFEDLILKYKTDAFDGAPGGYAIYQYGGQGETYKDSDGMAIYGGNVVVGTNKVAVTLNGTHFAVSTNGTTAVTGTSDAQTVGAVDIVGRANTSAIRSIRAYAPVSDADLPALSALT